VLCIPLCCLLSAGGRPTQCSCCSLMLTRREQRAGMLREQGIPGRRLQTPPGSGPANDSRNRKRLDIPTVGR